MLPFHVAARPRRAFQCNRKKKSVLVLSAMKELFIILHWIFFLIGTGNKKKVGENKANVECSPAWLSADGFSCYLLACPSRGRGTAQRELFNIFLVMVFSPPALVLYRCCWILYSTYGSSTSLLHRFDFFFCSCHKPRYLPIILNVFVFPQKPYSLFIFWRGISFVIDESGVQMKPMFLMYLAGRREDMTA